MDDLLYRLVNQPAESHTQAADGQSDDISDLGSFDWIIIDTPPVLAVTDAVTLMPSVSGLVFVVGAEMTSLGAARRALSLLRAEGPADVGVVLNRVNFNRNKHFYHRHYGYGQQYYYDQAPSRMPGIERARLASPPKERSGRVSPVVWGMAMAAGARAQLGLASVTPPPPVASGGTLTESGSTPASSSAESYFIVAASFPDAAQVGLGIGAARLQSPFVDHAVPPLRAAAEAATALKELDYPVLELAPSGTPHEFLVLVGPYTDLDRARQDEAQLRSRVQFRNAKIVASS